MPPPRTSDEIRESFLRFFEERDHLRLPSGSLVPAAYDPSVLLTTAGMHPLKPYFLGQEQPPHPRLATCQKCFRTPDIDHVGTTARHLTFFEMLGNFSIGDYFKQGAVEMAWEMSLDLFGFAPADIWVAIFEGDEELGLGPDEEAIEAWLSVGMPRDRIIPLPRSENFWQAGPTGPCGPSSEMYFDRGVAYGAADDLPGGDNDRFIEYWNLVFMQYNQDPVNHLEPLPTKNIDTGLGLNRVAALLQDTPSVFETDQFKPLIELGEELSGRRYGDDETTTRALRILADHTRGATFLVADGVVPSNEDRGYVLRRIMRRAIQQGRKLGLEAGFLSRFAERVEEILGGAYPELREQRDAIHKWLAAEEQSFGRTLEQGTRLLEDLIEQALENDEEGIGAQDAFTLHDTYGFPFELSRELAAEHGLGVDEAGFNVLMDEQRARARAGAGAGASGGIPGSRDERELALRFASGAGFATRFTGYETTEQATTVGALTRDAWADAESGRHGEHVLVKLSESPFYAQGGGQVSDAGVIECQSGDCVARVEDVFRLGEDQAVAVAVQKGELHEGERVVARVDRWARHATECNHTGTHLLHAALRERLGTHVRQAGSYVGPDKLRFDFSHATALSPQELRDVEDQVNRWILEDHPVRPLITTLEEAKQLGAMALFGEKYGEVVRMVEVGDGEFSRELCGGTHVRSTAQIGVFVVLSETSSAANVRRIEAVTGPAGVALLREHDEWLSEAAARLRTRPEGVIDALDARQRQLAELQRSVREGGNGDGAVDLADLVGRAKEVAGARVLTAEVGVSDPKALLAVADRLKGRLGDAVIVLGCSGEGRVHLVASVSPALVERGVKAGSVVRAAAEVTGGGGGGRDTMAQAGGRHPEKLGEALEAAEAAVRAALAEAG
ncbi:MAG TPA: alanine--tRNA ligase [Solirubrobacteraceae bacterium]|nr:alanine--tRNA ligase [Solirubrobacteraceae bacterium]